MAPLDRKLRKQLLLKMIQNSQRRRSLMLKLTLFLKSRWHLLIQLAFLAALLLFSRKNTTMFHHRTCQRLQRNTGWIENVLHTYSNERFKKTFRISRETFRYILSKIETRLLRQTMTEDPISPEIRLAMCLYRLAGGRLFLHDIRAVCVVVNEVTQAIVEDLWEEHVSKHFPKNDGRAMVVPMLLGSNGWLPHTPQMPRWWFGSM